MFHLQQEYQRAQTQILNIRTHAQIYLHFLARTFPKFKRKNISSFPTHEYHVIPQ